LKPPVPPNFYHRPRIHLTDYVSQCEGVSDLPSSSWDRSLDSVELFSGKGELTAAMRYLVQSPFVVGNWPTGWNKTMWALFDSFVFIYVCACVRHILMLFKTTHCIWLASKYELFGKNTRLTPLVGYWIVNALAIAPRSGWVSGSMVRLAPQASWPEGWGVCSSNSYKWWFQNFFFVVVKFTLVSSACRWLGGHSGCSRVIPKVVRNQTEDFVHNRYSFCGAWNQPQFPSLGPRAKATICRPDDMNNLLTVAGMMQAVKDTLRLREGGLLFGGVPCSSWLGLVGNYCLDFGNLLQ